MNLSQRVVVSLTALVAALAGAAAALAVSDAVASDRVEMQEATARIVALGNGGESVAFDSSPATRIPGTAGLPTDGYSIRDVDWFDREGVLHRGTPDCLRVGDEVRVGLVHTEAGDHGPGVSLVTYIRCAA